MVVHDVSEYVLQEVFHPPFYIQNLLPVGGSLLLYGRPGEMKSWLVMHMAFCIATGQDWLDFHTVQGRVMLINFEISPAGYHSRLVSMNQNFSIEPSMLFESSPSIMFLEDPAVFERFKADVDAVNPNIVILDCFSKCFGGDENSSRDMATFLRNIDSMKRDGRSVVIVHHSNKNLLVADPMDRIRGHSRLAGDVDTVIQLAKQPTCKQIQFGKTRLSAVEVHSRNIIFENYLWRLR